MLLKKPQKKLKKKSTHPNNTYILTISLILLANFYHGLWKGPIDRRATSVINSISNEAIEMGSAVKLDSVDIVEGELLARVVVTTDNDDQPYGIAVDGDNDGIYSTSGSASGDNLTLATTKASQGIGVVTQGRCIARVDTTNVEIGSELRPDSANPGVLQVGTSTAGDHIIAIALSVGTQSGIDLIPVDVQRHGPQPIVAASDMVYSSTAELMTFTDGDTMTFTT